MRLLILIALCLPLLAEELNPLPTVKKLMSGHFYAAYEAYLDNQRPHGILVRAYLLPEESNRGTSQKDIIPKTRHWVIELKQGSTLRQAFASLDDLGCGDMSLEHLIHAVERQFVGNRIPHAPAIVKWI